MLNIPESTRWLTKKGKHDEAWRSLQWIRADSSQATINEMEEIRSGVEAETMATEGFELRELLERDNFRRVFAAFAVFTAQQATGATAFAYFGPQYFNLIVGDGDQSLLLTPIFGVVMVIACGISSCCFSQSEIFPARIREPGVAVGVASQWLFNFVFSLTTPYMISSMGWGTFLLWDKLKRSQPTHRVLTRLGILDAVIAVLSFVSLKETRGFSLEAIAQQRFKAGSSPIEAQRNNKDDTMHAEHHEG
ncbi:hypothetical protein F4818DRAFT_457234 [Hypoxylon cercidicola]|nr:hypothetical protein F4818DRAFT_457234 [Hypoxylon cercidicola]